MPTKDTSAAGDLQDSLVDHLRCQGLDDQLARAFASAVLDHALTWEVKSPGAADECKAIMALGFGYQLSATGSRKPGVVNEALAAIVLNHYRRRPRPVYAQSEIAVLLASEIPMRHFHPIKPRKSVNGSNGSTGTESIIGEIEREVRDPQQFVPWLLIAHRHHAVRCSVIANERGFGSVVTPELPAIYDRKSPQIWRRRHLAYLVSDVISRFTMYATHRLYPAIIRADGEPAEAANGDTKTAKPAQDTQTSKVQFQDQLNGDVPLLNGDEDYAAIPCYMPQQSAPQPVAQQPAAEQRRGDWRESSRTKPSRDDASAPSIRRERIG